VEAHQEGRPNEHAGTRLLRTGGNAFVAPTAAQYGRLVSESPYRVKRRLTEFRRESPIATTWLSAIAQSPELAIVFPWAGAALPVCQMHVCRNPHAPQCKLLII
jgi:hypothetical protein